MGNLACVCCAVRHTQPAPGSQAAAHPPCWCRQSWTRLRGWGGGRQTRGRSGAWQGGDCCLHGLVCLPWHAGPQGGAPGRRSASGTKQSCRRMSPFCTQRSAILFSCGEQFMGRSRACGHGHARAWAACTCWPAAQGPPSCIPACSAPTPAHHLGGRVAGVALAHDEGIDGLRLAVACPDHRHVGPRGVADPALAQGLAGQTRWGEGWCVRPHGAGRAAQGPCRHTHCNHPPCPPCGR